MKITYRMRERMKRNAPVPALALALTCIVAAGCREPSAPETTFVDVAFITVVVGGGTNPIVGALTSSAFLALISTPLSSVLGTFIGRIGLLIASLVIIRFLPRGFSGYLRDAGRRRMGRGLVS